MRKTISVIALICVASSPAFARSSRVGGYVKSNGTYVQPHIRTTPNATKADNYSSRPNINPYSGKVGTVDPYKPKTPGY